MEFPAQTMKIFMATASCFMMMTGLTLYIRLAQTKTLDIMISALPSSYWLSLNVSIWGKRSLRSRLQLTGVISAVLFWPIKNLHIRNKKLDQTDIDNFPKHLKKQLLACNYALYLGAAGFSITYYIYN
ncbi:hypothetical protein A3L25_027030 [Pseudomonas putida]|uniref:Uncharacterized protein n=1 Tax=Pseudomonas putida TaxID=303 RepID=A0AAP9N503_PSEPU|nr:hypothetical protein [Pseudomonas putida]QJQ12885.1 hypothetical protein A3L25_027030 [Pseudomonas putida]